MGLHRVSDDELRRLVRALYRGHLACPVTRAGLVIAQFGDLEGHLNALIGRDRAAALAVIHAVLAEREAAHSTPARSAQDAELLWRGPRPVGSAVREPLELVQDWLARAERRVLWSGVPAGARHKVFQTLHAAQRGRSLEVQLIVRGTVAATGVFLAENFFHGEPRPRCLAADPGSIQPPCCLIVDDLRALLFQSQDDLLDDEDGLQVHSAIAIENRDVARALHEHLLHLVAQASYLDAASTAL